MSKTLTLTIVIPAYNEEHHIKACLDSIAAQTEAPDEVIVVDNNSTDKTAEIAASYPFVRVISESQQGIAYARNKGFDSAKSDLIGRIDADTVLMTGWVRYVHRFYGNSTHASTYALTGGCTIRNSPFPRFAGWVQGQIAFRLNRLIIGHYITWGSNMVIPKKIWQDVKPDVCMRKDIHEDLDIAIHLHSRGYEIAYRNKFRVSFVMRRVFDNRRALWGNLLLWPRSLRVHGIKTWLIGLIGAMLLFVFSIIPMLAKPIQGAWLRLVALQRIDR